MVKPGTWSRGGLFMPEISGPSLNRLTAFGFMSSNMGGRSGTVPLVVELTRRVSYPIGIWGKCLLIRTISDRIFYSGATLPRGFGVAYRRLDIRATVIALMPLNWLIGWGRILFFTCMRGPRHRLIERWEKAVDSAHAEAYQEAFGKMQKEYMRGAG